MNKPSVGYRWFLESVKAVSDAQDPVVEKLCLEGFMCPKGDALVPALPCGSQYSLVKRDDYTW